MERVPLPLLSSLDTVRKALDTLFLSIPIWTLRSSVSHKLVNVTAPKESHESNLALAIPRLNATYMTVWSQLKIESEINLNDRSSVLISHLNILQSPQTSYIVSMI